MVKPIIVAFGSQVSGRAKSSSDFDFAVSSQKPLSLSDRIEITESLSKKLKINEDKIDLIDIASASPILKFEIAKKGRLVEGDSFDFIRFRVNAFKEYVDTAKFRRLRERRMMKDYV